MNRDICREKSLCTGCTACASVCPKSCIEMKADKEGFLYPHVNEDLCVNCDLCEKTCPVNNSPEVEPICDAYVVRNKDVPTLIDSTSGGAFSAIANYVFDNGGVVYGVGVTSDLKIQHYGLTSAERERLAELRGSKYVQSDLGNCFREIKAELENGILVCFSGTPCQVSGLKSYLKKPYSNLITVDLICKGTASPYVLEKYVEYQEKRQRAKIKTIRFRNKTYGYHSGTMKIEFENGKVYYGSGRVDYMLKSYYKETCSRYSCYQCAFKCDQHCSDFTIFDCWHVEQLVPALRDDNKGYTNVIVQTEKGKQLIETLNRYWDFWSVDFQLMKEKDGIMMENSAKMNQNRPIFVDAVCKDGLETAVQKYIPVSRRDMAIEKTKHIFYKAGLIGMAKRLKRAINKK